MRASELLGRVVIDGSGRRLGPVRDLRISRAQGERTTFLVAGLVIGDGPVAALAHAWGYAEGRTQGPLLLRRLTARASREARFVATERVVDWGPGEIRITGSVDDLPRLSEEIAR